ncbi:MAG: RNA 2'-phosphotransferase [Leptospiraceae bacterium]|nr:RNA 2'-phosphotransferase [Leptospiraceae bacterium]MCP5498476.1 RNA 2'-phosphotransferase [Leptospiraceae bacterium]
MKLKDRERIGKFLSLILRHKPETIGIQLDENGWADVEELLSRLKENGTDLSLEELDLIVETNNKKRYSYNRDKTKIRANQGHSISVDVELKIVSPPEILFHGTSEKSLASIKQEGLKKMQRQHVHLSPDSETAVKVGQRHGRPVVLRVMARSMQKDAYRFYLSENGVWLTEEVPVQYIQFP